MIAMGTLITQGFSGDSSLEGTAAHGLSIICFVITLLWFVTAYMMCCGHDEITGIPAHGQELDELSVHV